MEQPRQGRRWSRERRRPRQEWGVETGRPWTPKGRARTRTQGNVLGSSRAQREIRAGASRDQAPAIGKIRKTADDPGGGLQDQEQHPQQKGADLADHRQEAAHADEEKEDRGELDRNQAGKAIERGTPACCRKGRTPPSMEEAGARASSTSQPGRTSRAAGCRRSEGRKTPGKEDAQELGAVGAAR